MKDVELLAESITRDAVAAVAIAGLRKALERRTDTSLLEAEASARLKEKETEFLTRALKRMADNWPDLKLLMDMPPINPS